MSSDKTQNAGQAKGPQKSTQKPKLELDASRNFVSWLTDRSASIAFSTYQAGKLFTLGVKPDGRLAVFERTIDRCMGLAQHGNSLYVGSLYQLWRFENVMKPGETHDGFDACYSPRMSWVTGDVDAHDLAIGDDGLVFANTIFSCLATPSEENSFEVAWQPPFISKLAAEDRCHLNGLAMKDGKPAYVTAVGSGDAADSWRDRKADGGVLLDVESGEAVLEGLSMPHSPRLHDGTLYFLNSGKGEFAKVDIDKGTYEPLCFCPGYARGMSFIDNYAIIGLSLPRDNKTFTGLPLDDLLTDKKVEPRCGLMIVDLKTGDAIEWIRIDGIVTELFDVAVLPGVKNPSLVGFKSDEIKRVIKLP